MNLILIWLTILHIWSPMLLSVSAMPAQYVVNPELGTLFRRISRVESSNDHHILSLKLKWPDPPELITYPDVCTDAKMTMLSRLASTDSVIIPLCDSFSDISLLTNLIQSGFEISSSPLARGQWKLGRTSFALPLASPTS